MKDLLLFVQIPAYNESKTIAQVIKSIPRKFPDISAVKILIIDDGSSDHTAKIALDSGADYVLKHPVNLGLAQTFQDGLNFCLDHGADLIVNTDADGQYDQRQINLLIEPILHDSADIVTGNRQIDKLTHMSLSKKIGNQIGSLMIRALTGSQVRDASSGFRAYSVNAARKLNVFSRHTYTHETLIQAHYLGLKVVEVEVSFLKRSGSPSRLISSVLTHIRKSAVVIIRSILMYEAYTWLGFIGFTLILTGFLGVGRFIVFFLSGEGNGKIQSLVLSSTLISLGFTSFVLGLIADLVSVNRRLLEQIKSELQRKADK